MQVLCVLDKYSLSRSNFKHLKHMNLFLPTNIILTEKVPMWSINMDIHARRTGKRKIINMKPVFKIMTCLLVNRRL